MNPDMPSHFPVVALRVVLLLARDVARTVAKLTMIACSRPQTCHKLCLPSKPAICVSSS